MQVKISKIDEICQGWYPDVIPDVTIPFLFILDYKYWKVILWIKYKIQ